MVMIHQRYRRTDRQTTCDSETALCSASRGRNIFESDFLGNRPLSGIRSRIRNTS